LASFGLAANLLCVLKVTKRRVRRLDRLIRERVGVHRRGVKRADGARVMPSQRVVDQHRQQIGVGRRLRRDDDRQRIVMRGRRGLERLVNLRIRPAHLTQFVMDRERGRESIGRAASADSARYRVPICGQNNSLIGVADDDKPMIALPQQVRVLPHHLRRQRTEWPLGLSIAPPKRVANWAAPRAAQMQQQQTGRQGRLAVLAAEREDGAARARGVVVNPQDLAALPGPQFHRLANELAFRHAAPVFDPGDVTLASGRLFQLSHGALTIIGFARYPPEPSLAA
jgi:hypothetical protein